ncbi:PQQ-binding-like beta-propeller repeat protein [Candidatus Bathyarchaeota archaeon A05DMB-2]|nr:PQQ-binding-like beta-propeller repeat protein [Candidatus Bathyarchaeota archaeon A05DMB-2]
MPKNKVATAIAMFLILTMSASVVLTQTATAHTPPWNIASFAYIVAAPSPVGVGEYISICMWVDTPLPSAAVTNDIRRHDYTLTITDPDGKVETQHWDVVSDTTGIQYFQYSPTKVGTYTLKFDYGGQNYTWSGTFQNDMFLPASKTTTFIAQEEPLPQPITSYPLPTEYWTRPIEGQNTDWYAISSNWLNAPYIRTGATSTGGAGFGRFQPDGIGPNSPHIMWSKPIQDGGVVGGNGYHANGTTYYMGGSYNVRFSNAIVMYGRLYYQEPYGNSGGGGDYVAVDLRTGKELWRINVTAGGVPSFGYLYDYDMYNQHGVIPEGWLFTSNFARSYDPSSGRLSNLNITNVPTGTAVAGPAGEILRYEWSNSGKWLAQWNSSKVFVVETSGNIPANCPITPARPTNMYWNGSMWVSNAVRTAQGYASVTTPAYDWNVTIPTVGSGSWSIFRDAVYNEILLLTQGSFGTGPRAEGEGANVTAISLKPTSRGAVLWSKYYPEPSNDVTRALIAIDVGAGVFVTEDKETMELTGFSLADGNKVWSVVPDDAQWDTMRCVSLAAYGNLYRCGFDGILHCYDMKNGNLLWTYGNGGEGNTTYAGLATAWGHYPIFVDVIADGKVYVGTTEHSPGSPFYKGTKYRCINATTGTEIWTLMGWGTGMYVGQYDIVADGFFVFLNCYDMQIYCVGKGPSALTVEAPMAAIPQGSSLVIRGTVTDISAGTKQKEQVARFPNGVPAVSDESMSAWMEYVYMQKPRPTNVTGVKVTLSVIDSNNNYREIGTATSDADGFFYYTWVPDIPGDFKVIATFAGSESYWPSHAETAFTVMQEAEVTPPPTPTPASIADIYLVPSVIGIIVAIAVATVVIVLMLRKRP